MRLWRATVERAIERAGGKTALSRKLGISRMQLHRWTRGAQQLPRWPNVVAVADAADLDDDERRDLRIEITSAVLDAQGYPLVSG